MNRLSKLSVQQALECLFQHEENESEVSSSDGESDLSEEDEDPSFLSREDEQQSQRKRPVTAPKQRKGRKWAKMSQPSHCTAEQLPERGGWKTQTDPDITPPPLRFRPLRTQGVQVDTTHEHSPLNLFHLFFSPSTIRDMCNNTNKYAALHAVDKSYSWRDVDSSEFSKFLGLLLFTSLVTVRCVKDYWKRDSVMSVPFPCTVMARKRFEALMWNLHLSDPEMDRENDRKKGTGEYDKLCCVQPLMDAVRFACKASYHPRRELAIDERMVATKAKTGMTQYMRDKPTKWGIKLFVLVDSSNGYTVDFSVYVGKSHTPSVHGLAYDSVMNLISPSYLGTGYHIYMDNFYTSPKLFRDLAAMKFGACGMYRENRKGCPPGQGVLNKRSPRGSVRWIRQDPIVFVKWLDTREVSVCSTIHPAYTGDTVKRRVKESDGKWNVINISCPVPIVEYNKYMGGVDRSDQLLQYYSTCRRSAQWYRTMFFHLLDIATTNAFIMHLELCSINAKPKLSHKDFVTELVEQLCGVDKKGHPVEKALDHAPVACTQDFNSSNRATVGRRRCQNCAKQKIRNTTPWKCHACDVPLCLLLDRNCFVEWHGLK